jgi:predicted nucleic acid-binding protein
VQAFLRKTPDLAISDLAEVEFVSAVARKTRQRELSGEDAQRIIGMFVGHVEGGAFTRLGLERGMYQTARAWLGGLQVQLRTLDALHLAVAAVHDVPIATADDGLARSAVALGIRLHRIGRLGRTGGHPAQ